MRVAFVSGGKDSYYAIYRYGLGVDMGLMLLYEFPRPSPHILNLGKSVETLLLSSIPVLVARVNKGREFQETVEILRKVGANVVIAGDVYIEDHLKYMERLAKEIGAKLVEPLWGLDPVEVLHKELEVGIKPLIIGCVNGLSKWLGVELSLDNIDSFIGFTKNLGIDPLGERGEYHTVVLSGPLHKDVLRYKVVATESYGDYIILRLI